jgi:heptaprenyl diphosphate synthase/octaprenyl-diphosphate synthase
MEASEQAMLPASLNDILRRAGIADDLARIEQLMHERTQSESAQLRDAGKHIVASGGKRLRAAMVLLAAHLGTYNFERAAHPAVAVELLHAATLIHDDLVDRAMQRRGRATVHARWDQDVAVMLGDYFFARAALELADEPDQRIIRYYVDAAQTMVEGELSPVTVLQPLETALTQYWRKTGSKTAVLFQAACKSGIAVSGGSDSEIEALDQFGYDVGLAFQIVDDVLDFTGDEETLGKPAGNDLREGTLTLPLIYAVADSDNTLLRTLAQTARPDQSRIPQLVAAVIEAGGTQRAMQTAREVVERAQQYLSIFPRSPYRQALAELAGFIVDRHQ